MQITFEVDNFSRRSGPRDLTNVLHYLLRYRCVESPKNNREIEKITCSTPSAALRYCRYVANDGISPEGEVVFLKNPSIAVRYLRMVGRPEFLDAKVQKRFRKKFKKNPRLAYEWSRAFNTRLSEEEEEAFCHDLSAARDYAMNVIRGKFPEKVHSMILLSSFEDLGTWQKKCLSDYIKYSEK